MNWAEFFASVLLGAFIGNLVAFIALVACGGTKDPVATNKQDQEDD